MASGTVIVSNNYDDYAKNNEQNELFCGDFFILSESRRDLVLTCDRPENLPFTEVSS